MYLARLHDLFFAGYVRIIFVFISFYFMTTYHYSIASAFYYTSVILDEFDGWAARYFKQCTLSMQLSLLIFALLLCKGTHFGSVMDMLTDRCAATCLIMVLGYFYPNWLLLWQILVALDISSHWMQMYSSLLHGETTHKDVINPILRFYYTGVSGRNFVLYLSIIFKACAFHILCW